LLGVAIALDEHYTGHRPDLDPATATGQQAASYMNDRMARLLRGLVRKNTPLIGHEQTPAPNVRSPRVVRGHAPLVR